MASSTHTCRICGNATANTDFTFAEKQFATGEEFDYFECGSCGCLQIVAIPEDMSVYYPADYESHRKVSASKFNTTKRFFKAELLKHALGRFAPTGSAQALFSKTPQVIQWLAASNTGPESDILDVGCGMGNLLAKFWQTGIRTLTGIDPFIPGDIEYQPNLSIRQMAVEDWSGSHDLVVSNHAFEHVPDPLHFLQTLAGFLAPGGSILIRIPLTGTYAWREFGNNWAQLDAPRHLYLHTEKSMQTLAEKTGLEIYKIIYDSQPKQIANSIKYQKGLPYEKSNKDVFSKQELANFKKLTHELNENNDGDQASFFLRPRS